MARMKRRGLSSSQKQELWEVWKRGQSSNDIARALGKLRGSIHSVLASRAAEAIRPAKAPQELPAARLARKRAVELIQDRRCLHRTSSSVKNQEGSCTYRVTTPVTGGPNGIRKERSTGNAPRALILVGG
jgi:hypothetical protein